MPTLRDVAREAGCSAATVSHYLTGSHPVGSAMQENIRRAVDKLGYTVGSRKPNSRHDSALIGLLFPNVSVYEDGVVSPSNYVVDTLLGMQRVLQPLNFSVVSYPIDWRKTALDQQMADMLSSLSGIVVVGGLFSRSLLESLRQMNSVPMVVVGSRVSEGIIDAVVPDNMMGMYKATGYLIHHGHRRIGLINGPVASASTFEKEMGYDKALRDASLEINPSAKVTAEQFTIPAGHSAMEKLLADAEVTAVVIGDDDLALGALQRLQTRSISVPQAMSIIGFGGSPSARSTQPQLTAVRVPKETMGAIAAQRIVTALDASDSTITISVSVDLIAGESVASPASIGAVEGSP